MKRKFLMTFLFNEEFSGLNSIVMVYICVIFIHVCTFYFEVTAQPIFAEYRSIFESLIQ